MVGHNSLIIMNARNNLLAIKCWVSDFLYLAHLELGHYLDYEI